MSENDSTHWSLFENRPAKERTSLPAVDGARGRRVGAEVNPRRQPVTPTRIRLEHVKC